MFLLCNGLLVFVGITRSLSWSSSVAESSNFDKDGSQSLYSNVEAIKESMLVVKEKTNKLEEVEEKVKNINLEVGKGSSILILEQEEELEEKIRLFDEGDEKEDDEQEMVERVDEEKVVEEANLVLSTEELNKKFDDFIRRMKEDLRIEAKVN
ncbi:glutamic acid-rich protein [Trifolium repens]|nr:glutamic acid-rich protein [Trifolium repens]